MLSHFGFNQINCFILITHYQQKRHEYLLSELEPLAQKLKPGLLFKAVQFTMQLGKTYHTLTPQNYAAMLKLIDDKLVKTPELNCRFELSFATSPDAFSKQRQLNQIYNTELNVEIFKKIVIQYFEAWICGPMLRSLFEALKGFYYCPNKIGKGDPNKILEFYGKLTTTQLVELSKREEPWLDARNGLPPHVPSAAHISKFSMANFYSGLID